MQLSKPFKSICFIIGASVCASTITYAGSLSETLIETYTTNPTLDARRSRLETVNENLNQAKGGFRPTISIDGGIERRRSRQDISPTRETRNITDISLEVTQNLYNGGGTLASIQIAKHDISAERFRLKSVESQVLFEGARTHIETYYGNIVYNLREQNIDRLKQQLNITQKRFNVGEVTNTDLAQAKASLARSVSDYTRIAGQLESSKAEYEQIVGIEPTNLREPHSILPLPDSLEKAVQLALTYSPDIQAATFDYKATKYVINAREAELLPTFDATASATHFDNLNIDDTDTNRLSIFLNLRIPLYQQGIATSQVRSAKKQAFEAKYAEDEARRRVLQNTRSAWNTYQAALNEISVIQQEIDASKVALMGVQKEASVGQRTVTEILDAEENLLEAEISLLLSKREKMLSIYNVHLGTGQLLASKLDLNTTYYDPEVDYNNTKDTLWGVNIDKELTDPN